MKVQVKEWREVNKSGNKSVSPLRKKYIARLMVPFQAHHEE